MAGSTNNMYRVFGVSSIPHVGHVCVKNQTCGRLALLVWPYLIIRVSGKVEKTVMTNHGLVETVLCS